MHKVSVAKLIESAIFNDAACRDMSTAEMLEWKFNELFEGNLEFIESVQRYGIQSAIVYSVDENIVYTGHHRVLCAWLLGIEFILFFDGVAGEDSEGKDEWEIEEAGWPTLFPDEH
jgi:hypothetical protein